MVLYDVHHKTKLLLFSHLAPMVHYGDSSLCEKALFLRFFYLLYHLVKSDTATTRPLFLVSFVQFQVALLAISLVVLLKIREVNFLLCLVPL